MNQKMPSTLLLCTRLRDIQTPNSFHKTSYEMKIYFESYIYDIGILQSMNGRACDKYVSCLLDSESLDLPVHGKPYLSPRCMDDFRYSEVT